MYLRKQGPGEVTAADIAPPAGVEVHNPELHIATLNGKGKLEMELTVERGRGYVSAAQNKQPGQEIGRIPIDSIYSPGAAGHLQGRGHPSRAAHRLRPADPGRRDQAVHAPAGRGGQRGQDPGRAVRPGPRAQRRRRGHRHRPVADRRRARGRPGAADRGAQPHRPLLQLPQARGHPHGRRARRPQRAGPARHPQLRRQVDRGSQAEAGRHGPRAQGLPARVRPEHRGRQLRATTTTATSRPSSTDVARPATDNEERSVCPRPPRATAWAAARPTSGTSWRTWPPRCSSMARSPPPRPRPSGCARWPSG